MGKSGFDSRGLVFLDPRHLEIVYGLGYVQILGTTKLLHILIYILFNMLFNIYRRSTSTQGLKNIGGGGKY